MIGTTATTQEILDLTEISAVYLGRLERQGVISRDSRNEWPLADTLRSLFRYLRDENRRGRSTEAAVRLATAKAKAVELRLQRDSHELISTAEAVATVDCIVGGLVSALSGVPARCTRDLQMRQIIAREINAARERAADECRRQAEALKATGKAAVRG